MRVTRDRLRHVNAWLDEVLRTHGLRNQDLTLLGFSQGCVLALIAGVNRDVKAIGMFGGMGTEPARSFQSKKEDLVIGREIWPRWEEFMPAQIPSTKIWAVH